jgi:probable addiction module antidote protein
MKISTKQSLSGESTKMRLKDIEESFRRDLTDSEFTAIYLKESLSENGLEGFLLALRTVVQASQGMNQIAVEPELGRESLYKALSESANPQFSTVYEVLSTIGLEFSIESAKCKARTS